MKTALLLAGAALAGCANIVPPAAQMDVKPAAFPHPGIYTGTAQGGTISFLLKADGRGFSCHRGLAARLFTGDVVYTGTHLHTEDGTLAVDATTAEQITVSGPSLKAVLRKTDYPPTACQEFFKNKA